MAKKTAAQLALEARSSALNARYGLGAAPPPAPAPPKTTTPPTTFGTPATPGTPGSPGYTPDYAALIQSDPLYQQQLSNLTAQGVESAADRKAATQRALINFGQVPDLGGAITSLGLDPNSSMFKMLFGDVDATTAAAAQGNPYSTLAGLGRAHDQNLGSLYDQLAARGAVRSGALTTGTANEGLSYGGAQFKSRQDLLDYLAGVQSAFASSQAARQGAAGTAASDSTTRQIAEHPYVAPTAAIPGALGTDAQGNPIAVPDIGNTSGFYNAPDYFAAHPLPTGTTTAQALAALSEAGRQLGPSTSSIFGGSSLTPPAATSTPATSTAYSPTAPPYTAPAPKPLAVGDTSGLTGNAAAQTLLHRLNLPQ